MLIKGLLLALCMLRWNLEHFAHLHWRTCTKPVKYQNTNSWFWNCSESVVFFCLFLFFSLSQQLDNLEHSAHLYGQFTTFELLTIFGPFTIVGPFTTFGLLTILWSFKTFGSFTIFDLDHYYIWTMYNMFFL